MCVCVCVEGRGGGGGVGADVYSCRQWDRAAVCQVQPAIDRTAGQRLVGCSLNWFTFKPMTVELCPVSVHFRIALCLLQNCVQSV